MNKYLRTNRPELTQEELDTPEELEQLILAGIAVKENRNIDWRAEIYSKTAWKWVNHVEYK